MKRFIPLVFSSLFLLICWQIVYMFIDEPLLFPSVYQLIKTLFSLFSSLEFYVSVGYTLLRGVEGIIFSCICAIFIAFLFHRNNFLYRCFSPIISIMRSIPVISFILIALILCSNESIPLIIGFLTIFPLLTENLTKGLNACNKNLNIMAHQFNLRASDRFMQILYPQIKPFLFSGLVSATGFGWRAIIMGEVLAQCEFGIGSEMKKAQIFISLSDLMAWTIVAVLISFLSERFVSWIEKFNFPLYFPSKSRIPNVKAIEKIQLNNIDFSYDKTLLFNDFNYVFYSNRIYGLSAPSGIGKTTLLNLIAGILHPNLGTIIPSEIKRKAIVFQTPDLLSHLTVRQNIMLPLSSSFTKVEANVRIQRWCEILEIKALLNKKPNELSFGQQQRVALARAMVYPSSLLLMDEPFKGLEQSLAINIAKAIKLQCKENHSLLIFASHEEEILHNLADEIIKL